MTDDDKLEEEARRIHETAQRFVDEISPWLHERSLELAKEAIHDIDRGAASEDDAREAAVLRLVADLREELERRRAAREKEQH
jgi:hypothetical protein